MNRRNKTEEDLSSGSKELFNESRHGRAKEKTSELEKEKKRKEKEAKVKEYKEGITNIFEKRKKSELDDEALRLMCDFLISHPDVNSVWNFRKEVLLSYKTTKNEEELGTIAVGEMKLTEVCLRSNPKSYCAWFHRLWIINNLPKVDLEGELLLCNKYLKLDSRNFHCWDYRRAVANKLGLSPTEELAYTMTKIEENFSNYSSWHYRSKLLPLIYEDPAGIRPIKEEIHVQELDLVQNAAFTDPYDQSAWFYLRWLLGRLEPNIKISQCYTKGKHCFIVFNRSVSFADNNLSLELEGGKWYAANSKKSSPLWITPLLKDINGSDLKITCAKQEKKEEIILNELNNFSFFEKPQFDADVSKNLLTVLKEQLESCNQLLDLEPESKWTLLTSVVLMQAIDKIKYKEEIYNRISLLSKYDRQRSNYYCDIRSRWIVENKFENWDPCDEINLSDLNLTSLYHPQYLSYAKIVDLSHNSLIRSLPQMYTLVNCQILHLDGNGFTTLRGFPNLVSLNTLTLTKNNFKSLDDVFPFITKLRCLKEIDISYNPFEDAGSADLNQIIPSVNVIFTQ